VSVDHPGVVVGEIRTHPSSISRNRAVEPESLDMKAMVPIGSAVFRRVWAVIIGPIVLVWR